MESTIESRKEEALLKRIDDLEILVKGMVAQNSLWEDRLKKLEEGDRGTGVYLDGAPEYVKDYIIKKDTENERKVGE